MRKKSDTVDSKVRMKEPLRNQIEKAAKSNGVSMNAEMVRRIQESFGDEDVVLRTLKALGYDKHIEGDK